MTDSRQSERPRFGIVSQNSNEAATVGSRPGAGSQDWTPQDRIGDIRVGTVAAPRLVEIASADRVAAAVTYAIGAPADERGIAEVCPDPLVFALEAGLPRPADFERSIDGGSSWCDTAEWGTGPLFAVSQITDISSRTAGDGRDMVRVIYTTTFTDPGGAVIGTAEGTSIHIGAVS